jgi:hypothetical protein
MDYGKAYEFVTSLTIMHDSMKRDLVRLEDEILKGLETDQSDLADLLERRASDDYDLMDVSAYYRCPCGCEDQAPDYQMD